MFLPLFLAEGGRGSWWPAGLGEMPEGAPWYAWMFLSPGGHPWRLAGEWLLLGLAVWWWPFRRHRPRMAAGILALVWGVLLLFQGYVALMHVLYGTYPQWRHEWALIQEVLPVFLAGMQLSPILFFLLVSAGVASLFYGLFRLFRWGLAYSHALPSHRMHIWGSAMLVAYLIASGGIYADAPLYDRDLRVQWLAPRMLHTLRSPDVRMLANLEERTQPYADYSRLTLSQPPTIHLLFLESYGSVAHFSPYIGDSMRQFLGRMQDSLRADGWTTQSAWSIAPIKGGRSWLSFTSALAGVTIDHQLAYNQLLLSPFPYPHLVRFLGEQGYRTHRLNTMQTNETTERLIPYARIRDFHAFDTWTLFHDIPYRGYRYHPMGGIPDQYALGFVHDTHIRPQPGPHFLFYITLDSHAPWYPPPPVVHPYTKLDTMLNCPYPLHWDLSGDIMDRYQASMVYQWEMVRAYLQAHVGESDWIVLIGDHQPPAMEWQVEGKTPDAAVPLHILHRHSGVHTLLEKQGFEAGLLPEPTLRVPLQHPGLYSLLVHLLAGTDPVRPTVLPVYPGGL